MGRHTAVQRWMDDAADLVGNRFAADARAQ
jgi:hypothetical protein